MSNNERKPKHETKAHLHKGIMTQEGRGWYPTTSNNKNKRRSEIREAHARYKRPLALALLLIALCVTNAGRLDAIPSPEQHEMSGTVQRVDRETITIVPAGAAKPQVFAWDKNTKFFRNGVLTGAGGLHSGVQVTIRCSHPIFGKPLLYRVVWQTNSNKGGGSTNQRKY